MVPVAKVATVAAPPSRAKTDVVVAAPVRSMLGHVRLVPA